jgi:NSS family neurotransmitter:Na+ symporter
VSSGIERATKILMPLFFTVLLILVIRSVTLEGAGEGFAFLFHFDFSKLTAGAVVSALGQALFSLSIGMGAMITYGSYLSKDENLPAAGITVALFDTTIALLGGLLIFPALFHAGADPAGGPGLVFLVMPTIFHTMPLGAFFGTAFYALLAIAALTSTISLLEVIVAYFVDEHAWSREKATWLLGTACFLMAIPSALSLGANEFLSKLAGGGFLDLANIIFGNYCLSLGAILICVFVAWKWGVSKALAEMNHGGNLPVPGLWSTMVRFVCPVAVALVLVYAAVTGSYL